MAKKPKNYDPFAREASPQILRTPLPRKITAPKYELTEPCVLEATPVDYPLVQDGKTTPYGQRIIDTQRGLRGERDKLPPYALRIARIDGVTIEAPTTYKQSLASNPADGAFYHPPTKKVVIPTVPAGYPNQVGAHDDSLPHEFNHGVDRALGNLLTKPFSVGGLDTNLSEHPLFAEANRRDMARIKDDPARKWAMDLNHYLPQEKGGTHENRYNNYTARKEVFAELLANVQNGGSPHDQSFKHFGKNAYTTALRDMNPHMLAVLQKFHKEMIALEKANPITIDATTGAVNNDKYKAALTKYLSELPKSPDAYLDAATNARLLRLPAQIADVKGTKEQVAREVAPDTCIDIKVIMKPAVPAKP